MRIAFQKRMMACTRPLRLRRCLARTDGPIRQRPGPLAPGASALAFAAGLVGCPGMADLLAADQALEDGQPRKAFVFFEDLPIDRTGAEPAPPSPSQAVRRLGAKLSTHQTAEGTQVLVFDGAFEEGDGAAVIEAMRENGADVLVLESPGGLIEEAQMIGYFLRSNNLHTLAGSLCASACTFALAGGIDRGAFEDSRLGLHRASFTDGGGTLEEGQQMTANYLRYFLSMGVDPELVALAGNASSDTMHWLSAEDARRLKLTTMTLPPRD